uniref:Uncharacterized protein n=1 Tax=Panagrolaimus sp. JU765 TaxID=591449 RepID=A0AC34R3F2_9BILA
MENRTIEFKRRIITLFKTKVMLSLILGRYKKASKPNHPMDIYIEYYKKDPGFIKIARADRRELEEFNKKFVEKIKKEFDATNKKQ